MYPKKWYKRGDQSKNALDNATLGCDIGNVLVLLGHNGAGKSSLINILTGMNTASSGDVLINQKSVVNELGDIRKDMGICQQDDILFPEMTGAQHLWLLGSIRGISREKLSRIVDEKLRQVKLYKYRDQIAATYSGGMKRRLGVAMAMLGDPKILLLDEPTSGMDPVGKKLIWNLIRDLRKDRIILLSTHSMEEADAVGDKIAILALGRLRAVGSPMHLKQRFGMGYTVQLCTNEQNLNALKEKVLEIFGVQKTSINTVGVQLISETTTTITYTIFRTSVEQMKLVSNFFEYLESKDSLVVDFVVSHTTLEDVFLRLTHGEGMVVEDAVPSWDNEAIIADLQKLVKNHEDTIAQLNDQIIHLRTELQVAKGMQRNEL